MNRPVALFGERDKQSGMFWGEPGAENVLALRCIRASRRLDQFWRERLNHHTTAMTVWLSQPSRRILSCARYAVLITGIGVAAILHGQLRLMASMSSLA